MLIETIIINSPINKSPNIIADISMIITEDLIIILDMINHSGTYNT